MHEPEEMSLREEMSQWEGYVSSSLLATEAIRACARYGPGYAHDARAWLEGVSLLPLDDSILDRAASLGPPVLRTLDAIHLATALSVRDEIGVLFTYDERLAGVAGQHSLTVSGCGD